MKMKQLHSLRVQLVLWTVALEAILLLILAAVMLFAVRSLQQRQIDETLRLGATQLNAVIDVKGGQYQAEVADVVALRRAGVLTWILTPGGALVKTVGDADELPLPTALPNIGEFKDSTLADGVAARLFVTRLQEGGDNLGLLVLAMPLQSSQRFSQLILWGLTLAIPIVLLLSTVGGFFLAGRALAPVSTITETARQISAADLSQRLQLDLPDDEIGRMARTFDAMLERLEHAFQRERQLTADVSHELRTPLALLKAQLSLARSRTRDATTLLEMMADMEGDVDRITRLAEQMLTLSWVEQPELVNFKMIDLGIFLDRIVNHLADAAQERGIALKLVLPTPANLHLHGDRERLQQVFINLIENAIRYTPTEGKVTVYVESSGADLTVSISDTGIGIGSEHLPYLFERFYRVDKARARDTGGFGLGLAISQAIVQMHGGQIKVSSALYQGTTFAVILPINDRVQI